VRRDTDGPVRQTRRYHECRAHIVSYANAMVEAAEIVPSRPGHAVRLLIFVLLANVANQFSIQP
jgi:hypothetical protein